MMEHSSGLGRMGSVVVTPTADRMPERAQYPQHRSDDEQDDPDGPQDRDFEHESENEKNKSESNHDISLL
jgi:hypothetical protein